MAPFLPDLSAMLLRNLLKKDTDSQRSIPHRKAFKNIKQSICREVSLTYFDPDKETVVQVDASLRGLQSALVQEGKVIAFASRALTDTEKSYVKLTLSVRCLPLLWLVRNFTLIYLARDSQWSRITSPVI